MKEKQTRLVQIAWFSFLISKNSTAKNGKTIKTNDNNVCNEIELKIFRNESKQNIHFFAQKSETEGETVNGNVCK